MPPSSFSYAEKMIPYTVLPERCAMHIYRCYFLNADATFRLSR